MNLYEIMFNNIRNEINEINDTKKEINKEVNIKDANNNLTSFKRGLSINHLLLLYCNGENGKFFKNYYEENGIGSLDSLINNIKSMNYTDVHNYLMKTSYSIFDVERKSGRLYMHIIGHNIVLKRRVEKLLLISNMDLDSDVRAILMRLLFLDLRYLKVA
jgi:hypothetical protein